MTERATWFDLIASSLAATRSGASPFASLAVSSGWQNHERYLLRDPADSACPDHGETSYRGSGRPNGRRALITGGDSGIGRAAAIAHAREGADVAIVCLPPEEPDAREVVQIIRAAGREAIALPGDIRTEAFCQDLVEQAVSGLDGLGILVNNAGRQQSHDSILDISAEQFDWTLRTNLYAMFRITKAAIPHMPPSSAIINTSSVNAYDPSANLLDYAMTKAAIANFTKGLVKQMIKRRIRVNAVAPGPLLDGAASEWRADDRERSEVRPAGTDGAAGATSRNCACLPCNSRPRSRAM